MRDQTKTELAHVSELQSQGMMNSADDWPTEATFSIVQSAIQDGVEDWDNAHLVGLLTVIHSAVRATNFLPLACKNITPFPKKNFQKSTTTI